MKYGLRDTDIEYICALFMTEPAVEQVWLYGSRAKGTNRPGSDIDLALVGPAITQKMKGYFHDILDEESPIPYFFDLVHWNTISNEKFKAEIQRTAQLLYQRP